MGGGGGGGVSNRQKQQDIYRYLKAKISFGVCLNKAKTMLETMKLDFEIVKL